MPYLYYSNHLNVLTQPLAHNLRREDPFIPESIVVPNFSLQKWLSLQLASLHGIAANYRFVPLEKAIFETLLSSQQRTQIKLLRPDFVQHLLIQIIHDKLNHTGEVWQQLKDYIYGRPELSEIAIEIRIYQLAERLSSLFQQYEYLRWEMLEEWQQGNSCFSGMAATIEVWQKALWLELFGSQGLISQYNQQTDASIKQGEMASALLYTLPQIYRKFQPPVPKSRQKLHIFGMSYISRFHQEVLSSPAFDQQYDIYVYTLNPCMEFWEDVESDWEARATLREQIRKRKQHYVHTFAEHEKKISSDELETGELFQNEEDNAFLRAWGRPGRENIRLLNEWNNWHFMPFFVSPLQNQKSTLLRQIQYDLLTREPRRVKPLEPLVPQDESLQILACPNLRREIEIIANEIWHLVKTQAELHLNQIAVIIPDMASYQTDLELVFQSLHNIPYNLMDGISTQAGRLLDGAIQLLGLCFTDYTRKDLFHILCNPNFLPQHPTKNIDQWLQWADELSIFYGIDQEDNQQRGYRHLKHDLYNWEQGFRRLTMGAFLQQESAHNPQTYAIQDQPYVPLSVDTSEQGEAASFMLIVRSLIADTHLIKQWKLTGEQWSHYLCTLLKTYLRPLNTNEEAEFQRLINSILSLKEFDVMKTQPMSYSVVYEYFKKQQQKISLHRGHYLAEGVTVSSFLPMRPIPFEIVFILGLGEGRFPSLDSSDNLDLRRARVSLKEPVRSRAFRERQIGDVSGAERDKYMFLETLISTRQRLYLSYIARNDKTDDVLNPSSIVQTLTNIIDTQYLPEGCVFQKKQHPLKSYDLRYFPELMPGDQKQDLNSRASHDGYSYDKHAFLQARSYQIRKLLDAWTQKNHYPAPSRNLLQNYYSKFFENESVTQARTLSAQNIPEKISVSLAQLRAFLECPLQATAKRALHLEDEQEEDLREEIHEPFFLDFLGGWNLLQTVLTEAFNTNTTSIDWPAIYYKHADFLELQGILPTGRFKDATAQQHLKLLDGWCRSLQKLLNTSDWQIIANKTQRFHFGRLKEGVALPKTYQHAYPTLKIPLTIKGTPTTIEISGHTEWWFCDDALWMPAYFTLKESKDKYWLRHFLNTVFLSAAHLLPPDIKIQGAVITSDPEKLETKRIHTSGWDPERSLNYLKQLLTAMFEEDFDILFPVEGVFESYHPQVTASEFNHQFHETIKNWLLSSQAVFSSQYGPIKYLEDYSPPSNPYQLTQQRFSPFFELMSFKQRH
ncbi:exodeoxyribonuclease V subunit gamma [Deltaproteobacteria bacterium TL4]